MLSPPPLSRRLLLRRFAFLTVFASLLFLSGCSGNTRVDDPQLRPIQDTLNTDLPVGTTENAVLQYLEARGYPTEPGKPGTIVAIIRHIDTEKLQPVTARVTFYFDANGKLNTTEIVRTFNRNVPQ